MKCRATRSIWNRRISKLERSKCCPGGIQTSPNGKMIEFRQPEIHDNEFTIQYHFFPLDQAIMTSGSHPRAVVNLSQTLRLSLPPRWSAYLPDRLRTEPELQCIHQAILRLRFEMEIVPERRKCCHDMQGELRRVDNATQRWTASMCGDLGGLDISQPSPGPMISHYLPTVIKTRDNTH